LLKLDEQGSATMIDAANGFGLLQLIPQSDFKKLSTKWGVDKGVRQITSWKMLEALVLSSVCQLKSLREIEDVFGIKRSTLSDACRLRSYGFFQELSDVVLRRILAHEPRRKNRRALREILGIDSTECQVHGGLFRFLSWRAGQRKASTKLHIVWNISKQWISDFRISGGRRSDLTEAKRFSLKSGKVYVFDRAYVDLKFWLEIMSAGSDFVTRLKRTPRKEALHKSVLSKEDLSKTGVLYDGEWTPSESACRRNGLEAKKLKLRHVIYRDPKSGKIFDFITSDFKSSAIEIAGIYKSRWSVELLFRWLKGHLNIRYLGMKNLNAVKVLLSIAVLVQLLVRLKMVTQGLKGSAWECLRSIRTEITRIGLQTVDLTGRTNQNPRPKPQTS
jgi:putative transposase